MTLAVTLLELGSLAAALAAAAFWFASARVKLPAAIRTIDEGFFSDGQEKPVDDLDRLTSGLRKQSRRSAFAAVAAGASALLLVGSRALSTAY